MGRLVDADALMPKLRLIREAEHQIYGKESWGFASKCITAIEDAPTVPQWIPVSERLPDIPRYILICDIDGDIYLGYRTRYGDYYPAFGDDRIKCVTAWMPLPEPYNGGEQE